MDGAILITLYVIIALVLGAAFAYFVEYGALIGALMIMWPITLPIAIVMLGAYELEKLGEKRRRSR